MVGQSLQSSQIFRREGIGRVALDREDADGLIFPAQRHAHQRFGRTGRIANHQAAILGLASGSRRISSGPCRMMRSIRGSGPPGSRVRGDLATLAFHDVVVEDRLHPVGLRQTEVQCRAVPLPEQVSGGKDGPACLQGVLATLSLAPKERKASLASSARLRSVMSRTKPNTRSPPPPNLETLIST